jgi:hypothetical protein
VAIKKRKPKAEGFLTTAAQAIGSTLGQLAKKAGVVTVPAKARKKSPAKKTAAAVKKAPVKKVAVKKKAVARKTK